MKILFFSHEIAENVHFPMWDCCEKFCCHMRFVVITSWELMAKNSRRKKLLWVPAASAKHLHAFNDNMKCSCFIWCKCFQWFAQIDISELLKLIQANCWNCYHSNLCAKCVDSCEFQSNISAIRLNKFCVCFLIACVSHTFPGCCS